jgi:hypothetical protein
MPGRAGHGILTDREEIPTVLAPFGGALGFGGRAACGLVVEFPGLPCFPASPLMAAMRNVRM